ncbi:hypothetical protein FNV43_RR20780 [Rhamnella rubrinervis]|uniref:Ribosomal RNA adenine methylase transferase N-terminal domain-containing protein n=1 Tax=Rhamnella rubrinervis TaxID=2594499 RepID=A0A8K0GTQ4_9ROSA|nr:hypothetical protein FNV43_RR20780 [Rhamnella rubrinervis]
MDTVLQIGPGTGNLTLKLLEASNKAVAIEIDNRVVEILHKRVLERGFEDKLAVIRKDALRAEFLQFDIVVANVRYGISSSLVAKLAFVAEIDFYAKERDMGFGAIRSIIRPLSRTLQSRSSTFSTTSFAGTSASPKSEFRLVFGGGSVRSQAPWFPISNHLHSLTETRFPKRRPSDKPRRKRSCMKPPGPYAWAQSVPGESVVATKPNEGSVKRRNEKKRMRQRRAFILAEKKKRKAQLQEAKKKKDIKKIERKMAAVARDRAWTQRLAELQQLEEEKKKSTA